MDAAHDRYADRLGQAAAGLTRLIRRLSVLSASAWSSRRGPVITLLRQLAASGAALESSPSHDVPELPDHALADAVAVIGGDVLAALLRTPDPDALDRTLSQLDQAWAATR